MPQKLSLRWLTLLVLLLLTVFVVGCKKQEGGGERGPCSNEPINHKNPKVCVDDTMAPDLSADPDPVKAWKKDAHGGKIHIQWRTYNHANLTVTIEKSKETGKPCILESQPNCANGICNATINPDAGDGQVCKYTVIVPGFNRLDPGVQVDNCCPTP